MKKPHKLSLKQKSDIDAKIDIAKNYLPNEFNRKPRSLGESTDIKLRNFAPS